MSNLGVKIRDRRIQLGISQEELAGIVGTNQKQISRYENGQNDPTAEVLATIARALKTTPDWLMGFDDLTDDEVRLIELYRSKSPESQRKLVDIARVV